MRARKLCRKRITPTPESREKTRAVASRPEQDGAKAKFAQLLQAARFSFEGNDFLEALRLCRQAAVYLPNELPVYTRAELFGIAHGAVSALEQLEKELQEAMANVEENPASGEAHFAVAYRFDALGYTEEALVEYQRVLARFDTICPECQRDCLNNIGWIHYRQGNYNEAVSWFDLALAITDPNNPAPDRTVLENKALAQEKLQHKGIESPGGNNSYPLANEVSCCQGG
jgi:tetratricopeptide (TPR) repeat protein